MDKLANEDIRIGTMVMVSTVEKAADYIRQILGHGFESFALAFWQTFGDVDIVELADAVKAELKGSGVIISAM